MYLGGDTLAVSLPMKMKYGKWLDNCVTQIPEGALAIFAVTLQVKLSINVGVRCENLVGKGIFGIS